VLALSNPIPPLVGELSTMWSYFGPLRCCTIARKASTMSNSVKATPNKFPVSRPGNGLLMQAGGRLLLLFVAAGKF